MSCCHGAQAQAQTPRPSIGAHVVAGILAANSMALALATNLNPLTPKQQLTAHGVLLGVALINLMLLGHPLFSALRQSGARSVAGLFVLGMMGALAFSLMRTCASTGPVYYEVVSILLVIYSVGRALTAEAQKRVLEQLQKVTLHGTVTAVRRGDGPFVEMPVADILPGDAFVVRPGGVVVADGIVRRGMGYVQTASLTGESQLRRVQPNAKVSASWFCADATLLIEATHKGTQRTIDAVAASVTQSEGQKRYPPSQSERVAAVFAPLVVAVATSTFAVWAWLGPLDVALFHALAVCLVACPCAFGFAAPIGLRAGTLRLAAAGVVVRQSAALHALANVNRVVFDKTGTLTATRIAATQTVRLTDGPFTSQQLLGLAACAQALVHHPISDAFSPWAKDAPQGWQPMAAQLLPGCGIRVTLLKSEGEQDVRIGDPLLLLTPAHTRAWHEAQKMLACGHKPLALIVNATCLALFALKDSPFTPPQALVENLLQRNIHTEVLSGDALQAVRALGVDAAQGAYSPAQKLAYVHKLQGSSRVCFVGDGINDSAALSAADVAIAMQSGSDLALELADMVLPAGEPQKLLVAIDVARTTTRLIRQNLIISLAYNTLGMAVAAAGLLNPVGAALLMAVSSLTVSARSLAMLRPDTRMQAAGAPNRPSHGSAQPTPDARAASL